MVMITKKFEMQFKKLKLIERPSIIIGNSIIADGLANMEGDHNTHGVPLPPDEIQATKENMGLPDKQFYVPKPAVEHYRTRFDELSNSCDQWDKKLTKLRNGKKFNEEWSKIIKNKFDELELPEFKKGDSLATRKAFGQTLEKFAEQLPNLSWWFC